MSWTFRPAASAVVAGAVLTGTLFLSGCTAATTPVTPVTPTPTTGVAAGGTLQRPLYSLVVPDGWTDLGSADTSGQIDAYLAKDGLSSGVSFSVFVDTSGRSLDTLVQQAKAAMPGAGDAPALTVDGRKVTGLQAEAEGLVLHQYYLASGDKLIALNWSWPKEKDASADVQKILDSFTWK